LVERFTASPAAALVRAAAMQSRRRRALATASKLHDAPYHAARTMGRMAFVNRLNNVDTFSGVS